MCLFFCCRLSYTAFKDMSIKSLFIFVMERITKLSLTLGRISKEGSATAEPPST